MRGSSYNYSYEYKKKKILKNCLYIIKMFCVLFIFIALPVWGVFKYRDYQRKQAKVIQDFLERKGLYATSIEENSLDVDTVSGIYIANNENDVNVNIESSSGIYIPNNNENIDVGESSSSGPITPIQESNPITPTPTKAPTPVPTPAKIENEYAVAEGDILTLSDEFKITFYCPCKKCCGNYSYEVTGVMNKTASGTTPVAGRTIAVCKKQIPLGTTVIIDGHEYIAEDVGGAIKWNRIDIYCDTHQEALNGGVQYKTVSIKR